MHTSARQPELCVVISTYNRADVLTGAIESLLEQDVDHDRYEIVVVDNNSTDGTRHVVESFVDRSPPPRYLFEPRQGVSYGRNSGILATSAPVIAFTDDDVRVSRTWVSTILTVLAAHPEAACVGGKVLPGTVAAWPSWLTREHWAPLALLDYGDSPLYVNANRRLCLITANVAFRRSVFARIGMFSTEVQAVGRDVATEDHELHLRLWRDGGQGLYWPELTATAEIEPARMRRSYHRRWHHRHGRFSAMMHDESVEQTKLAYILGAPAHFYRQAAVSFGRWISALLRLNPRTAFAHEVQFWSCLGFLTSRWTEFFCRRSRPSP
jgi:glycosyltransferase involved in cell wall biosynthesis